MICVLQGVGTWKERVDDERHDIYAVYEEKG